MRPASLLLFLLIVQAAVSQSDRAWEKVRGKYDKGSVYSGIRGCDRMLSGKAPDKRFLVLRAEGNNRIAEYERAMRDAREAVPLVEGELQKAAALQLGIAMMGMGFPDSARVWLERSLGSKDDSEAHHRLGVLDRVAGDPMAAIAHFDQVIAHNPDRSAAWRERGGCHAGMGDTAQARRDLDNAIELAPRDPVAWNSRGFELHARAGRWDLAIADYDRAVKFDPNYSYAFNNRGWARYKLGDTERALRDIALAGRKKPSNPFVPRNLGLIALESGDTTKACTHFRMALDLHFTALHGPEVADLMRDNCRTAAPVQAPLPGNAPVAPRPSPSNAPGRRNAP